MLRALILPVCTTLKSIANPPTSKTAGAVVALKEAVLLAAAGIKCLASGEQLVPSIRTRWLPIADFCTVARKTWAGHGALLFAKGAIRPSVRLVRAVRTMSIFITKMPSQNTLTAVPAHGLACPVAVVTEGGGLVAAIVTIIREVTQLLLGNAIILPFAFEPGRIGTTLKAH